jgi:hypothetical protein
MLIIQLSADRKHVLENLLQNDLPVDEVSRLRRKFALSTTKSIGKGKSKS